MRLSVTCKKILALVLCCALLLTALVIPNKASADSHEPSVTVLGTSLRLDDQQGLRIAIKVNNASAATACAITLGNNGKYATIGTSKAMEATEEAYRCFPYLYSRDEADDSVVYVLNLVGMESEYFNLDLEIIGKAWGLDGTVYTSTPVTRSVNSTAEAIAAAYPGLGIVLKDDGCLYKNNGESRLGSDDIANYVPPVYTATFAVSGADGATIDVFYTQDTTTASETNVTTAVARDSASGEPLADGDGQINFRVNIPSGYVVKEVTATEGQYKNIKAVSPGVYRVTKITGDLTISVVLEPDSGTVVYDDGDDTKHSVKLDIDEHVTGIDVYHTQTTTGDPDEVNATIAIARNSSSGEPDATGNGQINFKVKTADGYVVDKVEVLTGTFTNVKTVDEAAGIYRITKITSDLEVNITTKAAASPTETPEPTAAPTTAPTTAPTAAPTATPQIVKSFELAESMDDIDEDTEYAIVSSGTLTPNGMSSARYYLKDEAVTGTTTLMGYAAFDPNNAVVEETTLWTFEEYDGGYAMRAAAIDDDSVAYLNLDSGVAKMGAKQKLSITYSNSSFVISNGSNRLRFTNSGNGGSTSGYTGGSSSSSGTFRIYVVTEEEVGPTPDNPFVKATSLEEATEYAIVMQNIQPTGAANGSYYLKDSNVSGATNVMGYAAFSASAPSDEVTLWELEETGSGYAIRAVDIDDDDVAYLNLSSGTATMGPLQELTITVSGSEYIISADTSSTNRLRFTNSGNGPGFTCGTNAASSTVVFYEAVD